VVTDVLLWLRKAAVDIEDALRGVQRALVDVADAHREVIVPAYTHLQRAMPVLIAHQLLAHFEALDRDVGRVLDAAKRADRCPLGAGACVGSTLPLPRADNAKRLGFRSVSVNSLDAVADRDWAIEMVGACALAMTHMSRLAEELVLWSSQEFSVARIGDAWCTGSSMMPQKRNPDVAELVRGKASRVHGDLMALHSLLKGLPLAYNRDLQEDKEPLFDAVDTTIDCARLLGAAVASTTLSAQRAAGPDFSAATDLAEELVWRGMPFRDAHERIGALVTSCEQDSRGLEEATDEELKTAGLEGVDRALLTAQGSVNAKRSLGSTHPGEVARAIKEAKRRLAVDDD
jgi:argininosuccinate lyase